MERCWLFKQLTLRNLLTSLCAILSALMILQELYNFMIVKPTTAAKEEKEMMFSDIPETVICANPGFHSTVLARYGYGNGFYHRGQWTENILLAGTATRMRASLLIPS